jgi:hypothetical protein
MFVQLGLPDCDPRKYGIRDVSEPVDAFWVECTPDEAATLVEPWMSDVDRMSVGEVTAHYGWPHHFEGESRCCFLVARDLTHRSEHDGHLDAYQVTQRRPHQVECRTADVATPCTRQKESRSERSRVRRKCPFRAVLSPRPWTSCCSVSRSMCSMQATLRG